MTQKQAASCLEAFCAVCPQAQQVTHALEAVGFQLDFTMDAVIYPAYEQTTSLPAQYHFTDWHRTEVIYLAGKDCGEEGERLPPHASRWWVYPGRDPQTARQVAHALAAIWPLSWRCLTGDTTGKQEQVA